MNSHNDVNGSIAVTEADTQLVTVKAEPLEGRTRKISASILIEQSIDRVWQIITDYDHLADFIPNLAKSRRISHSAAGIRIEQIGAQNF
ncbi:MAG: hypothetical protein HC895_19300 [Leptolyngbyaceae cyanobacterium SM1_3_5]|nr:hypothetical protein [Leptolyngbyaceae cyanobacterium SM1_3_5]